MKKSIFIICLIIIIFINPIASYCTPRTGVYIELATTENTTYTSQTFRCIVVKNGKQVVDFSVGNKEKVVHKQIDDEKIPLVCDTNFLDVKKEDIVNIGIVYPAGTDFKNPSIDCNSEVYELVKEQTSEYYGSSSKCYIKNYALKGKKTAKGKKSLIDLYLSKDNASVATDRLVWHVYCEVLGDPDKEVTEEVFQYKNYIYGTEMEKIKTEEVLRGGRYSPVHLFSKTGTKEERASNFISTYDVFGDIRKFNSNQEGKEYQLPSEIRFTLDTKSESTIYVANNVKFNFTATKNFKIYSRRKSYNEGGELGVWEATPLVEGQNYSAHYMFAYSVQFDQMLYMVAIGEEDDGVLERATAAESEDVEQAVQEYRRLYKFVLDNLNDSYEERVANEKFDDALDNQTPYTDVSGVDNREVTVRDKVGKILGTITNVGLVFSVLISAALGIKYILSSPEGKADYKKDMVPYLVGVTLLLSVCTVVKIVQVLGENINNI